MAWVGANGDKLTLSDGVQTWRLQEKFYSLGTVRGRLGIAAGPVLLYGTAGLAWGLAQTSNLVDCAGCAFSPWSEGKGKASHVGFVGGGGAEWLVTQYVVLRAEYLFADLGAASHPIVGTTKDPALRPNTPQFTYDWDAADPKLQFQMWRVGVGLKFN
jgi:opacity protein-like surface antigen